jgi:ribonuclease HI
MNLTAEKLAERIVQHIWNELGALSGLGDLQFNMSRKRRAEHLKQWVADISSIIKESDSQHKYIAYFDGSARPNPGEMSIGGYINSPTGRKVYSYAISLGHGTNNVAEYSSLIHLLKESIKRGIQRILIRGDSQLIINQVTGAWQCKDPYMSELCNEVKVLMAKIADCQFMWEPRAKNKEADKLTKIGHGIPNGG